MSMHEVNVLRVGAIEEHANADSLEVIRIGGYTCCVHKDQFHAGDLAAYIEPDTLVPVDEPEFAFLKDKTRDDMVRIKAVKLRGIVSMGLLINARPGWSEGDDVMEQLGCVHYDPPVRGMNIGGEQASAPNVYHVKYDVDSWRKYPNVITDGEDVVVSEKVHGASARYVVREGELHCSSPIQWKREDDKNLWWMAAREYNLAEKLSKYPDHVFYGEVYGRVQDLRYGAKKDDPPRLVFFDVMYEGRWLDYSEMVKILDDVDLSRVKELFVGSWDSSMAEQLSNGISIMDGADHLREGCVIRPLKERWDDRIGRVLLKVVGSDYLTRKSRD